MESLFGALGEEIEDPEEGIYEWFTCLNNFVG
jgi:hypothetical protein